MTTNLTTKQLKDFPGAAAVTSGDLIYMSQNGIEVATTPAQLAAGIAQNASRETFVAGTNFTAGTTTSLTLAGTYGSINNILVLSDAGIQTDCSLTGQTLGFNPTVPLGTQQVVVIGWPARSIGVTADASVTAVKLAPNAVTAPAIAAGAVTAPAISVGAVTAPAMATGAVSAKLATEAITQAATGFFWTGNGARIHRLNDRVLIGDATVNDGAFPNVTKDWLATYQSYFGGGGPTVTTATICMANGEPFLAAAQTATGTAAGQNALGVQGYALANNTAFGGDFSWAFYGESHRTHAGASSCYGMELCVVNRANVVNTDPYHGNAGATYALQLDSGCGFSSAQMPGLTNASVGLQFVDNSTDNVAQYVKGIVFGATSILGTNGVTGQGTAIAMARGHTVQWYVPSGDNGGSIVSFVTNAADATQIAFGDSGTGLIVNSSNSKALMGIPNIANAANYIQVDANVTTGHVGISAQGTDANIHVHVLPKGTGSVMLGAAYTAGTLAQAGYVTMLDASGVARRFLIG